MWVAATLPSKDRFRKAWEVGPDLGVVARPEDSGHRLCGRLWGCAFGLGSGWKELRPGMVCPGAELVPRIGEQGCSRQETICDSTVQSWCEMRQEQTKLPASHRSGTWPCRSPVLCIPTCVLRLYFEVHFGIPFHGGTGSRRQGRLGEGRPEGGATCGMGEKDLAIHLAEAEKWSWCRDVCGMIWWRPVYNNLCGKTSTKII